MQWRCLACGKLEDRAKKPRWCPCGVEDPFIQERGPVGDEPAPRATRATEAIGQLGETVTTGCHELDELLGGGVLAGSSVLVHGPRGSGKTRLIVRWASRVPCLFAHAELAREVAGAILTSTGANVRACWLYPLIDGWEREAERVGARAVVLDSISETRWPGEVLRRARAWARGHGAVVWCIIHENSRGRAKGGTDTEFACDYEIDLSPGKAGSGVARVHLVKSRLGPSGRVLVPLVPGAAARRPRKSTSRR